LTVASVLAHTNSVLRDPGKTYGTAPASALSVRGTDRRTAMHRVGDSYPGDVRKAALKIMNGRPEFELVGVLCHSRRKDRVDVGQCIGRGHTWASGCPEIEARSSRATGVVLRAWLERICSSRVRGSPRSGSGRGRVAANS